MNYTKDYKNIFVDERTCNLMLLPYRSATKIVISRLEGLDDEIKSTLGHSPIHQISSRIKTPQSIIEKLHRKQLPLSVVGINQLYDVAGIRVICKYIDDIYYIRKQLLQHRDIILIKENDYFNYPKENGYRSLHLIVSVPVYMENSIVQVPVEIQIRTIGMDMWASLEHQLKYKNEQIVPQVILDELKNCADVINETDEKMLEIYKKLKSIQ